MCLTVLFDEYVDLPGPEFCNYCRTRYDEYHADFSLRIEFTSVLVRIVLGAAIVLLIMLPVAAARAEQTEWETLNGKVMSLYRKGEYSAAIEVAKQAIKVAEQAAGLDHPDVATSVNNLAMLYDNLDKFSEAETLYKRALAIKEKSLGSRHISVATILINLALLYDAQQEYELAEPLYRRALKIQEDTVGSNHPDTMATLKNLAALYRKTNRQADAELQEKRLANLHTAK